MPQLRTQCPTACCRTKFNELLESYRAEILPDIFQGWNTFTSEQQLSFIRVNNFFCGLHFLVGLADAAETLRLIRTTCKAVQKQCSQLAGCHLMFKAYLQFQGITTFPTAKFQGNRFNTIFYNAAGIFDVRNHLIRYLEEIHHIQNKLFETVLQDLNNNQFIVGCRALGIVSKCITGPLSRLLESTKTMMSELGRVYQRVHRLLLKWSENATERVVEREWSFRRKGC